MAPVVPRAHTTLFLVFAAWLQPTASLRAAAGRSLAPQHPHRPGAVDPPSGLVPPPGGLDPLAESNGDAAAAHVTVDLNHYVGAPAHSPPVPERVALAGGSSHRETSPVHHVRTPLPQFPIWPQSAGAQQVQAQQVPGQPAAAGGALPAPMHVAVASPTSVAVPKPRLFFLFLVYDKINNEDIWNRFFATAVQGFDYRAFVHCKTDGACAPNIQQTGRYEIISSVETTYCFNLVGGMNALIAAALEKGGGSHPNDKFILVSDSTLPVKPFSFVQQKLTQDDGSDFCIFPRNEWAEVVENFLGQPQVTSVKHVAVKHHQWAVLSREHAKTAVQKSGELQDLMRRFQLNTPGFKNTGCLDEFWHFAVLFGSLKLSDNPTVLGLPALNGERVSTDNYEIQGQCDTFVNWVARASGSNNNMTRLTQELMADPGTDMDQASDTRPSSIHRVSKRSLKSLRDSPFLFARKVDNGCAFSGCDSVADAFERLVFSTPPQPLAHEAQTWVGQGSWVDTRNLPVNIAAADGAVQVTGSSADMHGKGGYCNSRISVLFTTGFRAEATISPDGSQLRWSNGAVWWRQGR